MKLLLRMLRQKRSSSELWQPRHSPQPTNRGGAASHLSLPAHLCAGCCTDMKLQGKGIVELHTLTAEQACRLCMQWCDRLMYGPAVGGVTRIQRRWLSTHDSFVVVTRLLLEMLSRS